MRLVSPLLLLSFEADVKVNIHLRNRKGFALGGCFSRQLLLKPHNLKSLDSVRKDTVPHFLKVNI